MIAATASDLTKVPYLALQHDERIIGLCPFWEGNAGIFGFPGPRACS
jgi:hypothetical protein